MFDLVQFGYHTSEKDKFLAPISGWARRSDALSPGDMDADEVDYAMRFPKDREMITLCGLNQTGFERFCTQYGSPYRCIKLFKCQLIDDLSPLGQLPNLEYVYVFWNIRSGQLWDMRGNTSLRAVELHECRKMTQNLGLLATAPALTDVIVCGSVFNKYPMASLDVFASVPHLQYLRLYSIRPIRKEAPFFALPEFERYDFDAGLYTTEEIARMVAQYPHISGTFFGPYGPAHPGSKSFVRVSGSRKPELEIPRQQAALERHTARFNDLVSQYRKEMEAL